MQNLEDVASTRYALTEPVAQKVSVASWIGHFIEGLLTGFGTGGIPVECRVRDGKTGQLLYQTSSRSDAAYAEVKRSITYDLSNLSVAEFREKYSIS